MLDLVAIVQNTATVAIGAVVIALLGNVLARRRSASQAAFGAIFGAAGLLSMAHPAIVTEGLFFDGRIPVVILSGVLGGPLAASVTAGMIGGMRFLQGGAGALAGIGGIVFASLGGVLLHLYFRNRGRAVGAGELLAAGALAASVPFFSLALLGDAEQALRLVRGPSAITAFGNLAGVMFSGLIVTWDRERRDMAKQLKRALDTAEAANAAKTAFLGHLSHEIRSPLASLMSGLYLLRHQAHGPLGDRRYSEYADMMQATALHLSALVENVLDMSSVESGNIWLRKENVAVAELVREATAIMQPRADDLGVNLATEVADLLLHVDPRRMRQVLINLLANSLKFTPRGGGVRVTAAATEGGCRIVVADTGIGIAAADCVALLQPYVRGESRVEAKGGGTGLGLPLSKRFVELHGGSLRIESVQGSGTSVIIDPPKEAIAGQQPPVGATLACQC